MRLTVSIFEIRQALNEVGLGALPDKFELEQPSFRLLIDVAVIRMVNKNLHAIIGLFFFGIPLQFKRSFSVVQNIERIYEMEGSIFYGWYWLFENPGNNRFPRSVSK